MINIVNESNFEGHIVGSKAANLFLAKKNGISVPELFAIDAESVYGEEMAVAVKEYIAQNFNGLLFFSIRSSSLMEDGKLTSFAGQFDTFLDVEPSKIMENIKKCYDSIYKENIREYCTLHDIKTDELKMSVIVQEMISGESSGVLFTSNPQGLINEMVIVAGYGRGDGIVEDKVATSTYYYNKNDKFYYYETMADAPVYDKSVIEELVAYGNRLEDIFGNCLDIEFTIKSDKIYILQIRPITTLDTHKQIILDNSNIVESYPGITLPLTSSFVGYAYYGVFKGLAYRCMKNRKLVDEYDGVFAQMVTSVNGRIYYKISNWYTVIKFLPFSKKIIPIWQEMMGVTNKEHNDDKNDISWFQRMRVYINSFYEAFRVQRGMKKLNESFIEVEELFHSRYNENMPNSKLVNLYDAISEEVLKEWDITLLNDLYTFLFTSLVKKKIKKSGIDNYEEESNKYISGITNIESMKPVRAMIALAKLAIDIGIISELKMLSDNVKTIEYLKDENTEFKKSFLEFIRLYGDRTVEELKLETKTFRVCPVLLAKQILEYAQDESKLNETHKIMSNKKDVKIINSRAMKGINNREISRLNRCRVYGMVRTIFLTIGKNMVKENQIDSNEDIFYITIDEVFDYIKGGNYEFRKIVLERRKKYSLFSKLPAYTRLVFAGKEFDKSTGYSNTVQNEQDEAVLKGTPCSYGKVSAEVIVITDPSIEVDVKNKIIVTKMTDPGWVFMLTMAKGIISEKGSLLSHTAIISRELGIPSIVGIKNITNILKTGEFVEMDGSSGEIVRISL